MAMAMEELINLGEAVLGELQEKQGPVESDVYSCGFLVISRILLGVVVCSIRISGSGMVGGILAEYILYNYNQGTLLSFQGKPPRRASVFVTFTL